MRGFKLTNTGDISIKNNKIEMIADDELTRQTIQYLLSTNKGECFYNENEGINFRNLLGKNVEDDTVKSEILDGLMQIDQTFAITDFSTERNAETRKLDVKFTATTADEETVTVSTNY